MKQNTEQLKKIEEVLNKLAYNCLNYGKEGNNYMVSDALKDLLPHLISSDEMKREAVKEFTKWLKSTNGEAIEEWRKQGLTPDKDALELANTIIDNRLKAYLTQSKEGGE